MRRVAETGIAVEQLFARTAGHRVLLRRTRRVVPASGSPCDVADRRARSHSSHQVWDNSNIIESYSGVTTPLTFSFIRRAYSIVYQCFAEVMGISPRVVHEHRATFANMLGFFQGRVYYNLKSWYRLVRLFPGYRYNSSFMESMMGLKEPLLLEDEAPPARVSLGVGWWNCRP